MNTAGTPSKVSVMKHLALPMLAVAIVTWVCYFHTMDGEFIFDDFQNIVENPNVHMDEFNAESIKDSLSGSNTPRPVAYLSFALNHYFGGLEVAGYHAVNTIIHMLAGFAVYLLSRRLFPLLIKRELTPGEITMMSLGVALVFVAHPIQTQAVTYIVQRMTSLCALFYISGLLCYIYGREADRTHTKARVVWWVGAFACWLMALGTKQYAVTLPAAILLYEWIAQGHKLKFEKSTIIAASVCLLLAVGVVLVFKSGLFFEGGTLHKLLVKGYDRREFDMSERVLTQARVVMHYIGLSIWPAPSRLVLIYDYPTSTSLVSPITTLLSMFGIVGMAAVALLASRRAPLVAFGILWFLLHLAVESTIIPLEMVYEHRMYLPIIGLAMLFVAAVFWLIPNRAGAIGALAIVTFVLSVATYQRNDTWRSHLGLMEDNAAKHPEPRVFYNMAVIHRDAGRYTDAIAALQSAVEVEPRHQQAMVMAGALLRLTNNYQDSMHAYTAAIEVEPGAHSLFSKYYWEAYTGRGSLLNAIGQYDLAAQDYSAALGLVLPEGVSDEQRRVRDADALAGRALAYMNLGRTADAVADLNRAIELNPMDIQALNNLAWLLATSPDASIRDGFRAVDLARRACEQSNWTEISTISTYAASLSEAGDFDQAVEWQRKCIEMAPPSQVQRYRDRLELYLNYLPYRSE
ncbi:MAG: tetratricopeptide repeat protein [Phycisphaera sp.]|nr:MAG: tetratricopeptide repeat protein [Phycisphaera sp.]